MAKTCEDTIVTAREQLLDQPNAVVVLMEGGKGEFPPHEDLEAVSHEWRWCWKEFFHAMFFLLGLPAHWPIQAKNAGTSLEFFRHWLR